MQIDIQTRDFLLTSGLRTHVERRVQFSLSRFRDRLRRIDVRLSDLNGPRGGVDKRCRMMLRLQGMPDIVVDDTEADMYAAIHRSAERAQQTLSRQLARARGGSDGRARRPVLIDEA